MSDYKIQFKVGNVYSFPIANSNSYYTDDECYNAFVMEMNKKSSLLGLTNTNWINPSGLIENGNKSMTTCRDLCRVLIEALSYNDLCRIWNKDNRDILIKDCDYINIETSVKSQYLENYYPIIGGKTGGGDGYYGLVVVTKINNSYVVGAILGSNSNDNRFKAMKELFDAAKITLSGGSPNQNSVTFSSYACAYEVPNINTSTIENISLLTCLYEQGADITYPPMSTTKVMTILTALDYIRDIHFPVTITERDLKGTANTSGCLFSDGDVVSFEDLMYAALLPSSNQAANAIARVAGNKILLNEKLIK